ncbi:MAG: hypothetical protein AB1391_03080 [Candidatus Micrarchaeota archaeon]
MVLEKTSELVWLYIKRRPFIKEMLKYNLVNYSRLARKLSKEIFNTRSNFYAIKAALIRLGEKIRKKESDTEAKVLGILKNTTISIKNKIGVIITNAPVEINSISSVKSGNFYTYIAEQREIKKIKCVKNIISLEENLNLFILSSTFDIENTPGVISTILHMLAVEDINVCEFISSYTDTLLVIKEADNARAYELLSALTK